MKIGALIVTTGLPRISGVAVLVSQVGTVTAGQRMISCFQRAGVSLVGLVVGPENKKSERAIAQNDVIFLRGEDGKTSFFHGMQLGLAFLEKQFDRVFVVPGDTPLFLPQTLEALLQSEANVVQPENKHVNGFPVLLDRQAMEAICNAQSAEEAEVSVSRLQVESVQVDDPGILLRGGDMSRRKNLIRHHNAQLARPVTEITLSTGSSLYDPKLAMMLHLVEQTRSVREACSMMQISYSTAWNLLNRVEDELGFPLVVRIRGGSTGSGSELTEKGRSLMDAYDSYVQQLNQEAQNLFKAYFSALLDTE